MKIPNKLIIYLITFLFIGGCAYYNTFFNAKANYNQALKKQKNSKSTQKISGAIKQQYQKAIDKSWKLIKIYGDSNKYADDALLLIGKSYYQIKEYVKAERILTQFLQKYLRSEHIPEAKLWLARTYIAEGQKDKALDILNSLLGQKLPKKLAAEAFYILGELYYNQEEYDNANKNLNKCVDITHDDGMKGDALYMMGESYYNLQNYENAIGAFQKLSKLDIPPVREYEAKAKVVEALIELKKYDKAEKILKKMLSSQRFKNQYSLIETRIANLYEIQGQTDFARDYYYEIIKKYPRSEGASLCYYYLGQLYEFEYGNMDSAKVYYDKVKNLRSRPEVAKEAKEKEKLLSEYLKIRNQLRKDRSDIYKLEHGDSLLSDSMEVAGDSVAVDSSEQKMLEQQNKFIKNQNNKLTNPGNNFNKQDIFSTRKDSAMSKGDSLKIAQKKIKKKVKKVLINRSPEAVRKSFKKNSFGVAEYFLLKYQNYDSAATDYQRFIKVFKDSILTPKAYYALYFIYHDLKHDSLKADSLKQLIINRYPNTLYGKKLLGIIKEETPAEKVSQSQTLYLQSENLMDQHKYDQALKILQSIAQKDSGSVWAQKSRYAIAYIYENYLKDVKNAIAAYTEIVKEYPDSKFAEIARKKIAPPPPKPKINPKPEEKNGKQLELKISQQKLPSSKEKINKETIQKTIPSKKPLTLPNKKTLKEQKLPVQKEEGRH